MRRVMRKFWKEFAYLVGFAVLVIFQLETIGMFYLGVGAVWFVVQMLRHNDPKRDFKSPIHEDLLDSRNLHGSHYRRY